MKRILPVFAALLLARLVVLHAEAPQPQMTDVFVAGQDGVHTYRIPAMVLSPSGVVLVFCEARKEGIRRVRFENIRAEVRAAGNVGMIEKGADQDPFKRTCSAVASHPDARIEDVSFKNIVLLLPGGGTAEHAARLNVGELLESTDYMKWAVPFDGELPASALYLRHVQGVRLEDVRLTLEKPDARAFIAGDDVEGLTLRAVVARAPAAVPGLAKLADVKDFTEEDCRLECGASVPAMVAPTAEELRRLVELRKRSAEHARDRQK